MAVTPQRSGKAPLFIALLAGLGTALAASPFLWSALEPANPVAPAPPAMSVTPHPFGALALIAPALSPGPAPTIAEAAPEPQAAPAAGPSPFETAMKAFDEPPAAPVLAPPPLATPDRAAPYMPFPRLASRPPTTRARLAEGTPAPVAPLPNNRGFFAKLFGRFGGSDADQQKSGTALAYATPEDGGLTSLPGRVSPTPMTADGGTAVYDIAAHTVTLPTGEKLEAHSGLGPLLDDPARVNAKNRGATPPQLYDLRLRESLFHGVEALRLTPVGNAPTYGRVGLLAHTYMLGPNGDSNGCVSFRDYARFLEAYKRGQVKRLLVVARAT